MSKQLHVTKALYSNASLGSLCASLKSSKKPYVAYSDKSIVSRAVIGLVSIEESDLEKLDKVHKPTWWHQLQSVKSDNLREAQNSFEDLEIFQFGFMSGRNTPSNLELKRIEKEYNLDLTEFRLTELPNGYCTLTKRF